MRLDAPAALAHRVGFRLLPLREWRRRAVTLIKACLIGTFVGILPGTGAATASFISYAEAKRAGRCREKLGTNEPEGLVASETANNAVTGGALVPTLALGIPGDPVTAVLMAALIIQGIQPGVRLFVDDPGAPRRRIGHHPRQKPATQRQLGRCGWVDQCWPSTRRTRRSEIPRAWWRCHRTAGASLTEEALASRPAALWRYRELLRVRRTEDTVSLGEAMTPLTALPQLARTVGRGEVLVKDEGRLPTGAFKAHGLAVAVSLAKALGVAPIVKADEEDAEHASSCEHARTIAAGPRRPDPGQVPGAVGGAGDAPGLLGPAPRRLAHPEPAGELAVAGRAHPSDRFEVKHSIRAADRFSAG